MGPVETSYPSPAVHLVAAVGGTDEGTVEGFHLDSYPYSCLRPSQPSRFLTSRLPGIWIFVAVEWIAAFVDSPASPVDCAFRDLPCALPYCPHHTVELQFQTYDASGFAVDEADVVAARDPSPFRRPLVQCRSFHDIMTVSGRPQAFSYPRSQVHPYLAEYEGPFADLALAADMVESRRFAAGVLAAPTPLGLPLQVSIPRLWALVVLPEV